METNVTPKWCTYGAWGKRMPTFIGKLEDLQGNSGKIRYTENQMYPLEWWDMDYVSVFDTLEEAIIYMIKQNSEESVLKIKDWLHFPTDVKKLDWDELRKLELEHYKNKLNGNKD